MSWKYFSFNRYSPAQKNCIVALCLLAICLLTYSNSLRNGFLMDDYPMLIENHSIGDANFLQLNIHTLKNQVYFRPVTHLFNLITYIIFGTEPSGYHLVNLFLFYLAALALYQLSLSLLQNQPAAFLTALLFCAHPINGVAVNYKNATSFSFLILAVLLSLRHILTATGEKEKTADYSLGLVWYILALLCHETVIAYPLYLAAILFFIKKYNFAQLVAACAPPVIVTGLYLLVRSRVLGAGGDVRANIFLFQMSVTDYLASFIQLVCWYITKLISLRGIVLAWDTPVIKNSGGLWLIIFAAGVLGCILFFWKYRRNGAVSLAVSWFLIGFVPVALACFSRPYLGFVIQPHWLFFSSIGFFLLVALAMVKACRKISLPLGILCVILLLAGYILTSRQYNYLWNGQERYCRYWLSISPRNYWPNFWLGYSYLEEGDLRKAKEVYLNIVNNGHSDAEVYGNLGIVDYKLGNLDAALDYFLKSLRIDPGVADTYYYMGLIYARKGDPMRAERFFLKASQLDPTLQTAPSQ
jgi:tetratricopeptide (TPR) repeat protein